MNPLPPATSGHYLLESGLHADRWFELDTVLCDPSSATAPIDRLAALLAPFAPDAICGPLIGGALLAQAIAQRSGLRFLYARRAADAASGPYPARYELPAAQRALAAGRRVAIVDDMISAGSSTHATWRALRDDGVDVCVTGALFLSGRVGEDRLRAAGLPVVAVERLSLNLWSPEACPLCAAGLPLRRPDA